MTSFCEGKRERKRVVFQRSPGSSSRECMDKSGRVGGGCGRQQQCDVIIIVEALVVIVVVFVVVPTFLNIDKSSKQAYTGTEQRVSCGSWPKCDAKGAEDESTEIQYGEEKNRRGSLYARNGRRRTRPIRAQIFSADLNNLFFFFFYIIFLSFNFRTQCSSLKVVTWRVQGCYCYYEKYNQNELIFRATQAAE